MTSPRPRLAEPPRPPRLRIHTLHEEAAPDPRSGFLQLQRLDISIESESGERSAPTRYDLVRRRQMDASVVVAHCRKDGEPHVYLRTAVRPPLALRPEIGLAEVAGQMWELPAGLIDAGETPAAAAARELGEELGFDKVEGDMAPLGPRLAPLPAALAELQYFFAVVVDPAARRAPAEDGALEQNAAILLASLEDALAWCHDGHLLDAKTEIGLRRLAEIV